MKVIDSELRYLEELYSAVESRLEAQREKLLMGELDDCFEEDQPSGVLQRVMEMDDRLYRLLQEWNQCQSRLSNEFRDATVKKVSELEKRALRIQSGALRNEILIREIQDRTRGYLSQLRAGTQFVKSVRGLHDHVPRYIDSQE